MSVVNLAHQAGFPNSVYFHFSFCSLKHSITTPFVPIYFSPLITSVLQKKDYKRYVQDRIQFQRYSYVEGIASMWKPLQDLAPEIHNFSNTKHKKACVEHWDARWPEEGQCQKYKHRQHSRPRARMDQLALHRSRRDSWRACKVRITKSEEQKAQVYLVWTGGEDFQGKEK